MKKFLFGLILLVSIFVISIGYSYANDVVHYTKDEVINKVTTLIDNSPNILLTDEEIDTLRDKNNGIKQNVKSVTLASYGEDNRSFKLELIDSKTNKVLDDVKWYYHNIVPRVFEVPGENLITNPVAKLDNDGTVTIIRGASQGEGFYVWAEYNKSIYRFLIEPLTELNSKEEMGRKEARRIVAEKNWKDLPSKAAKAEAVYKYLIETIKYDTNHNFRYYGYFYGAFIEKLAVCNGYAKAFVYMMSLLDVEASFSSGWIENDSVSHAWAYVQLDDNKWYLVDPTYGDPEYAYNGGQILVDYYYYLQNMEEFNISHSSNKTTTNEMGDKFRYNYYKENNLVITSDNMLNILIDEKIVKSTSNEIDLVFAKDNIYNFNLEKFIKNLYPNATVIANNTNGSRLGGINKDYFLQDYKIYKEKVTEKDLKDAVITFLDNNFTYTGNQIKPNVSVKYNNVLLEINKDYKINYYNNTEPGVAKIEIIGINSYTGSISKDFTIKKTETLKDILINKGFKINNNYVLGFKVNTHINDLKNYLGNNITINSNSSLINTGANISLNNDNYSVIIKGDTNGDGLINSADLLKIRQHLLGTSRLNNNYFYAGLLIDNKTDINSADLLKLRQYLLGTSDILQ